MGADLTCPSTDFCASLGNNSFWTTSNPLGGPSGWSEHALPTIYRTNSLDQGGPVALSCPTSSFCVLLVWLESGVTALVSHTPTTGVWQRAGSLGSISGGPGVHLFCQSVSLCIASGQNGVEYDATSYIESTEAPGSTHAWGQTTVPHPVDAVACLASNACVVVTIDGFAGYSSHPLSGAWNFVDIDRPVRYG